MSPEIKFEIITPERVVLSDEFDEVVLPSAMGEIGILPNHKPLIALLAPGEIRVKKGGETLYMAISGGFVEVRPDKVVVLADTAERAEEIDETRAEEARQKAQKIRESAATMAERAALADRIEKQLARLKVAKHRRKRDRPGHASPPREH